MGQCLGNIYYQASDWPRLLVIDDDRPKWLVDL